MGRRPTHQSRWATRIAQYQAPNPAARAAVTARDRAEQLSAAGVTSLDVPEVSVRALDPSRRIT